MRPVEACIKQHVDSTIDNFYLTHLYAENGKENNVSVSLRRSCLYPNATKLYKLRLNCKTPNTWEVPKTSHREGLDQQEFEIKQVHQHKENIVYAQSSKVRRKWKPEQSLSLRRLSSPLKRSFRRRNATVIGFSLKVVRPANNPHGLTRKYYSCHLVERPHGYLEIVGRIISK